MSSQETYVTKKNPSVGDWLEYNERLFSALRAESPVGKDVMFAPLTDVDEHARREGVETPEYFEQLKTRVGNLGGVALKLVHSEMDDAWHVIIG